MKQILKQTWINVLLGLCFMVIAFVALATDDFNGFISMMFVAFFNFIIVLYEAAGVIYDKLDKIEKKMGAKS